MMGFCRGAMWAHKRGGQSMLGKGYWGLTCETSWDYRCAGEEWSGWHRHHGRRRNKMSSLWLKRRGVAGPSALGLVFAKNSICSCGLRDYLFIFHSFIHFTNGSFNDSFIQRLVTVFYVQSIVLSSGGSESPRPGSAIISQTKLGSHGGPFTKTLWATSC